MDNFYFYYYDENEIDIIQYRYYIKHNYYYEEYYNSKTNVWYKRRVSSEYYVNAYAYIGGFENYDKEIVTYGI